MITDAIISAIVGAIVSLFGLLPTVTLPAFDNASTVVGYGMAFDQIFPISFLLTFVGVSLVIHAVFVVFDLALFIYHQFWGSS